MTPSRFVSTMASVLVTLAIALPAAAQGKSGKSKGKPAAPPPTSTNVPMTASGISVPTAATAPFAWMDDASLMAPGTMWLGVSMVQWHGSGQAKSSSRSSTDHWSYAPRTAWREYPARGGRYRHDVLQRKNRHPQERGSRAEARRGADTRNPQPGGDAVRTGRTGAHAMGITGQHPNRPRGGTNLRELGVFLAGRLVCGCRIRQVAQRPAGRVDVVQPRVDEPGRRRRRRRSPGRAAPICRAARRSMSHRISPCSDRLGKPLRQPQRTGREQPSASGCRSALVRSYLRSDEVGARRRPVKTASRRMHVSVIRGPCRATLHAPARQPRWARLPTTRPPAK